MKFMFNYFTKGSSPNLYDTPFEFEASKVVSPNGVSTVGEI